jgi:tungstate transport system substrate-binding protein
MRCLGVHPARGAASLFLAGLALAVAACASPAESAPAPLTLRVATTTSLYDTGLWDVLEPLFEERYGVELDVVYAGTGKALEYGRRGDVHVLTVHARAREEEFIARGYGVKRVPFAYNYFLIVGPPGDPAGIKGLTPEEAMKKLFEGGRWPFISRGDDSGTHSREKAIWKAAGYDYEVVRGAGAWYIEAGSGMGPTLKMASEKGAYTLTDIGTYLAYSGRLDLVPLVPEGDALRNVYSAIAIVPQKMSNAEFAMAGNLIDFLVSDEVQDIIGTYGIAEYGQPLFRPCAGAAPCQD